MTCLSIVVNYIEMARVTGVPLNFILTRGQQIKVFSMLLRKTRKENLLIPNLAKHGGDDSSFEGATVIEPKKAYYEVVCNSTLINFLPNISCYVVYPVKF